MARKPPRGLFVTGTGTEVGKTYIAARVVRQLTAAGHRVGVYKPAASGCESVAGKLVSTDALTLWQAAGSPGTLADVCPQVFAAPLAPHLAAEAEGRKLDAALLRSGLEVWLERSDVVVIEGAGGLMSPLGEAEYVADLAYELGFPLLVVAANELGVINDVLQTLITAEVFRDGLPVAGVVLNQPRATSDESSRLNAPEIGRRAVPPLLAQLEFGADSFEPAVDWWSLAAEPLARRADAEDGSP